jgi:hypothetical protein
LLKYTELAAHGTGLCGTICRVPEHQLAFLMKLSRVAVGLLFLLAFVHSSYAVTRIENDKGGSLGTYLLMFATMRDSGERVVIDGSCFSACTLVTAMIPKERVCITERAALGFHASWADDLDGNRVISSEGTQLLYQMYPTMIRKWIAQHGGLGPNIIVMKGRDLERLYRPCRPEYEVGSQ